MQLMGMALDAYRAQAAPRIADASRWTMRTWRFAILQLRPWSGPLGSVLDRIEADLYEREQSLAKPAAPSPSDTIDLTQPFELAPAGRAAVARAAAQARSDGII